jgi:hypothetical protein
MGARSVRRDVESIVIGMAVTAKVSIEKKPWRPHEGQARYPINHAPVPCPKHANAFARARRRVGHRRGALRR